MSSKTKTTASKEEATPELVPKLRFPEFRGAVTWREGRIADIAVSESSSRALNKLSLRSEGYPVYGADSCVGFIDSFDQADDYIAIVKDGSGVGRLALKRGKSSILGTLAYIKCKPGSETKLSWLYYCLNSLDLRQFIKGSGIPHIYFSDYATHEVLIPPLPEQQKIAECLSSVDELMAAQARKLEALKTHKKGLMQQLFPREGETQPRLRFPEFKGEWNDASLGDLCFSVSSGKDARDSDGAFDLYGSTGVIGKTAKASYDTPHILVARVGANAGYLTKASGQFGVTDNTLVIRLKPAARLDYIFHYLGNININKLIFGSGQPLITGSILKAQRVLVPSAAEQSKISTCLSSIDDLIKAESDKLEVLNTHKKGLMQQLFPSPEEVAG